MFEISVEYFFKAYARTAMCTLLSSYRMRRKMQSCQLRCPRCDHPGRRRGKTLRMPAHAFTVSSCGDEFLSQLGQGLTSLSVESRQRGRVLTRASELLEQRNSFYVRDVVDCHISRA